MSTQENDDNRPDGELMFSKAAINGPLGPLTYRVSTDLDEETFLMFTKFVRECGTDRAGALRDWCCLKARGQTYTEIVRHAEKVNQDRLFGTEPEQVLTGTGK